MFLKASLLTGIACGVLLATVLGPYLGSVNDVPNQLPSNIQILVTNLDQTPSGFQLAAALATFLTSATSAATPSTPLPSFTWVTDVSSLEDLTLRVSADEGVWGGIAISPGATAALALAVATAANASSSPSSLAAALAPLTSALVFVWDEGRSPTVAPRIGTAGRTLLLRFTPLFARSFVGTLAAPSSSVFPPPSLLLPVLAARAPSLLTSPLGFLEFNVRPAAHLPSATPALTVGLILILVCSMAAAKVARTLLPDPAQEGSCALAGVAEGGGAWGRKDGVWGAVPPPSILLARAGALVGGALGLGLAFPLLFAGTAAATWTAGPHGAAALGGVVALTSLSVVFYLAGLYELGGEKYITLLFLPTAYYNALAGWNLDLAAPGYRFFQYAPLFHAARLARHCVFPATAAATPGGVVGLGGGGGLGSGPLGSQAQVGAGVAALVVWAAAGLGFYFLVGLVLRPWALVAARARWAAAQGRAEAAGAAGAGASAGAVAGKGGGGDGAGEEGEKGEGEGGEASSSGSASEVGGGKKSGLSIYGLYD